MISEYFNLNQNLKQRITFKDFFDNVDIKSKDEKKFREAVKSMYLKGVINQNNSGFRKFVESDYNYTEILLMEINLENIESIRFLEEIIHKAFSNPIIIILNLNNTFRLSLAKKRINKQIKNLTVVEEEIQTEFISCDDERVKAYCRLLNIKEISVDNLKNLYEYYFLWVQYHYVLKHTERIPQLKRDETVLHLIQSIKENEKNIILYEDKKKNARQVSDKMTAHTKLVKYNKKNIEDIAKLKEAIK